MSLKDRFIDTKKAKAKTILIYSTPGVGKTTLASEITNSIFFDLNKGLGENDHESVIQVKNFAELIEVLKIIKLDPDGKKNLVFDGVTDIIELLDEHVAGLKGADTVMTLDYGKGSELIFPYFNKFLKLVDQIREQHNINIIFTAHAVIKKFDPPDTAAYDRYQIFGNTKIIDKLYQWAEIVFHLRREVVVIKDGAKNRASETSRRFLVSEELATNVAKSRFSIPGEIEYVKGKGWDVISQALRAAHAKTKKEKTEPMEQEVK